MQDTMRCDACGKPYGLDEFEMVNITGLSDVPSLCRSCAVAWNDQEDHPGVAASVSARRRYEEFKKGRRAVANGPSIGE